MEPVAVFEDLTPVGRRIRGPEHRFVVSNRPYEIQPFMIAPVLPGETMKNLSLQARIYSDPLNSSAIGWFSEHYVFYVKLTDLDDAELFKALMLSTTANLSTATFWNSAAKLEHYKAAVAGYDFVGACLKQVVQHYFRRPDETWNANMLGNLPASKINQDSWLDSVELESAESTPDPLDGGVDDQPIAAYQEMWQRMRDMRLVDMTYEDWLKSHGIRGVEVEKPRKPELVRYEKSWTYPTNTINPTDGAPSAAASWSKSFVANKDRFFKEPGFLFGVTVHRPKVYMGKQKQTAVTLLNDAFSWLPQALAGEPYMSLRKVGAATGPLAGNTGGTDYWVDIRDLFLYGDQFTNHDLSQAYAQKFCYALGLPSPTLNKLYPGVTDVELLFKSAAASGQATGRQIHQDGIVKLSILGKQVDHT